MMLSAKVPRVPGPSMRARSLVPAWITTTRGLQADYILAETHQHLRRVLAANPAIEIRLAGKECLRRSSARSHRRRRTRRALRPARGRSPARCSRCHSASARPSRREVLVDGELLIAIRPSDSADAGLSQQLRRRAGDRIASRRRRAPTLAYRTQALPEERLSVWWCVRIAAISVVCRGRSTGVRPARPWSCRSEREPRAELNTPCAERRCRSGCRTPCRSARRSA